MCPAPGTSGAPARARQLVRRLRSSPAQAARGDLLELAVDIASDHLARSGVTDRMLRDLFVVDATGAVVSPRTGSPDHVSAIARTAWLRLECRGRPAAELLERVPDFRRRTRAWWSRPPRRPTFMALRPELAALLGRDVPPGVVQQVRDDMRIRSRTFAVGPLSVVVNRSAVTAACRRKITMTVLVRVNPSGM